MVTLVELDEVLSVVGWGVGMVEDVELIGV